MKNYVKILFILAAAMSLCSCSDYAIYVDESVTETAEDATEPEAFTYELTDLDRYFDDGLTTSYDDWSTLDDDELSADDEESTAVDGDEKAEEPTKDKADEDGENAEKKPESKPQEANSETDKQDKADDEKLTENKDDGEQKKDDSAKNDNLEKKSIVPQKKAKLIDVPFISQDEFPTGCELVSASMLLKYRGIDLSPGDFLEKYMPKAEFEEKNGKLCGGDPNKAYIGDPTSDTGYGCYCGALIKGFEKLFKDGYCDIIDLSGMELRDICNMYVEADEPVLIWASIDMAEFTTTDDSKWLITGTDKEFTWMGNEHCLVMTGYDDEKYYFNDPLKGKNFAYKRDAVEKRYKELGMQAVTVRPW